MTTYKAWYIKGESAKDKAFKRFVISGKGKTWEEFLKSDKIYQKEK